MSPAGGYPIEEFLEAITAQLDQTQDALRLKAVNRPLTFALKDFNVDLKVFVEMDMDGRVTFRPAAPNEEGASTVSIGFTTITRPAIEENTISMEMANAPTLDELGLAPDERRQLARVGVRNAAQLRNLERNAGDEGMARHTGVNIGRIRGALNLARPRLNEVVDPDARADAPPSASLPQAGHGTSPRMPFERQDWRPRPDAGDDDMPGQRDPQGRRPEAQPPRSTPGVPPPQQPFPKPRRQLPVGPEARKIDLRGNNLLDGGRMPVARLDGQRLNLLAAQPSALSFALPEGWALGPGRLTVEMPDGDREDFDLSGGAGS
ncbi:hypothetical protein [Paracoccus sp. (in: a-proteobacteria)]|uniref:hypothetical protein n=1 Tax=Paracoccus sp. TaxID=267 RepID=UPI003A899645